MRRVTRILIVFGLKGVVLAGESAIPDENRQLRSVRPFYGLTGTLVSGGLGVFVSGIRDLKRSDMLVAR